MERTEHIIDAEGKIAGRLASQVALVLQGKKKVAYEPHTDCGDAVRIENVQGLKFSGKKIEKKIYYRATGYHGGIRTTRLADLYARKPEVLFRMMVLRMLPKNKLRIRMIKRLRFAAKKKS